MPTGRGAIRGPAGLLFLSLLFAFVLVGCDLTVEDPQRADDNSQRNATSVAELPAYDASVSAIDFDPPLSRDVLLNPAQGVKLLAAIENKGTLPLASLTVDARVITQKGEEVAHDRTLIDKLSPGETKLVEFRGMAPSATLTSVPRSPSYRVRVSVSGAPLDANGADDVREVIVRVAQ